MAGLACFVVLVVGFESRAHAATPAAASTKSSLTSSFSPAQVSAGYQLFVARCSSCHGANAEGTTSGPTLVGAGAAAADFYLRTGRMPLNDPGAQPVGHSPAFGPDQISDLVAYVASLGGGPAIPTVLPGNLPSGFQLYSENCAQCHNVAGAGGALGNGDIVPSLTHASALDVVEAARVGPAPMPVFGPSTLTNQQISAIASYVEYLHHPDDRGGLGLGHLGPIPEGFVGWVFGLGTLLVVTRLIGTRG